jgi:hypothetical protein
VLNAIRLGVDFMPQCTMNLLTCSEMLVHDCNLEDEIQEFVFFFVFYTKYDNSFALPKIDIFRLTQAFYIQKHLTEFSEVIQ